MRAGRIGITHVRNERQPPFLKQLLQLDHLRMQAEVIVELEHLLGGNADPRTHLVIVIVGVGNERVESVISAGQLQDHEDVVVLQSLERRRRLGMGRAGQRDAGFVQERRDSGGESGEAGQTGEFAAVDFQRHPLLLFMGTASGRPCYSIWYSGDARISRAARATRSPGATDRHASTMASRVAARTLVTTSGWSSASASFSGSCGGPWEKIW